VVYSLIIAHVNDVMPANKMVAASARIVLIFGIGSATGPMVVGALMDIYGAASFLWFGAAIYILVTLYGIYRIGQRSVAPEDKGDYVFLASRATSIATAPILEEAAEGGYYSQSDAPEES